MNSEELQSLLGTLKRLDEPPPPPAAPAVAPKSRYSSRDAEAEAYSLLKRLRPVEASHPAPVASTSAVTIENEATDEDSVLDRLAASPRFLKAVSEVHIYLCPAVYET
jgi:hypothetical protein